MCRMGLEPDHQDSTEPDVPVKDRVAVAMTERRPARTLKSAGESYDAFAARLRLLGGLPT